MEKWEADPTWYYVFASMTLPILHIQFGKQSGSFNIFVSDISAFTSQDKNDNSGPVAFLMKAWEWLKNWFLYIFGLRRDNGQGFIRL